VSNDPPSAVTRGSIMSINFNRIKLVYTSRPHFDVQLNKESAAPLKFRFPRSLRILALGVATSLCWMPVRAAPTASNTETPDLVKLRGSIEAMKANPRGPFDQIRWFCDDGARLPPTPSACKPHGGGHQHGQWSETTQKLRAAGYRIANFYADLNIDALLNEDPTFTPLAQMLIEQFLIQADDGWILRQARHYRGAYQEEGERKGARALLQRLAATPGWVDTKFLFLRTAAASLAHGVETGSVREVRQLAATLSDQFPSFKPLRNQIHGRMSAGDAAAVRTYAASAPGKQAEFERLARLLDEVYTLNAESALKAVVAKLPGQAPFTSALTASLSKWSALAANPEQKMQELAGILAHLRDATLSVTDASLRLQLIDASLVVESEYFALLGPATTALSTGSRRARLDFLRSNAEALYLISTRQLAALKAELAKFDQAFNVADYKRAADYLALAPHWVTQNYRLHFGAAVDTLAQIEPKATLFIQDALRGSPLFFYAQIIDDLVRDANALRGVRNELFGENVGGGLRGLNPGLTRGFLRFATEQQSAQNFDRNGIYVLPETVADLPPVAGILTAGEGNPLSHVQLLARNLGIPNVAVDQRLLDKLRAHADQEVLLAVSPGGSVRLSVLDDTTRKLFAEEGQTATQPVIKVDLAKLDLTYREFVNLNALRASDSGRIVGPKAAKLGELKAQYPAAVTDGIGIPFGLFRDVLERPFEDTGLSAFVWMQGEYKRLAALSPDSAERQAETERFRGRLEQWIANSDPGVEFRTKLTAKMNEVFGADGSFGVFVRSDTNVEDLPGFTGAGLNLTLPNVVGFENIFRAIAQVWASPFTARSFAWRQSLMETPEHVYPAVLLLKSVDSDKSGVLVTSEIDTGSPDWLSVALNEGVGGAVDGQSAESVRINIKTGDIRLLAQATAPLRRQVAKTGGIVNLPTSGRDEVLSRAEAALLIKLAGELPTKFPAIADAAGNPAPADIEFGFLNGELKLFQIRPFLDNANARGAAYLRAMDTSDANSAAATVDLDQTP
jgi:Pyruvate phosphate dikinase, AMP/ATP-binding domain